MLNEILSWFIGSDVQPDFSRQMIARAVLDSEHKNGLIRRRALHGELHSARNGDASANVASDIIKRISQHDSFINFMTFCAKELGDKEQFNWLLLSLKYLVAVGNDDQNIVKIKDKLMRIITALLPEQKEETLIFFHHHKDFFDKFELGKLIVAAVKTIEHFDELASQLRTQENALSIAHYFDNQFDDPEKFAAIILWLVRRNVPVKQIIQTNLLQKFLLYNSIWLGLTVNPVKHFYNFLEMFPEARDLITEASVVECEDRCLEGGQEATRSHSLMGLLVDKNTLHRVSVELAPLDFTPTAENFDALRVLFSSIFLKDAVIWHAKRQNIVWHGVLHNFLNQDSCIEQQLPALLNFIGARGRKSALKSLAALIDDATIEKLLTRHSGAVLHLLPYQPLLRTKVTEHNMAQYLDEIRTSQNDAWNSIAQLVAVLISFRDSNKAVACLVYEALLDLVLAHASSLDDEYLLRQLRKLPEAEAIINNRCTRLRNKFDDCIAQQVALGTLSPENYNIIEDHWLSYSRNLVLLNEIVAIVDDCPTDKYKLQAHWAKMYFSTHPDTFIVNDYVEALGVSPELLPDRVSDYERVLIELLTTIDNESVRNAVIAKLDANEARRHQWLTMEYSDGCVLNRAAMQGNLGLICWLETKISLFPPDMINHVVRLAAEAKQWKVINHFCSTSLNQPQQQVFKELLSLAARAGQIETIRLLCEEAITHLQVKHVEHVLENGALFGHLGVVQYCLQRKTMVPSTAAVARAFKRAFQFEHQDIIALIGDTPPNCQLLSLVERALVRAAIHNQFLMAKLMCGLTNNAPRQVVIEEAFIKATKFGNLNIAQHLRNLPANAPRQKAIDGALAAALANGNLPGVQFICHLSGIGPRQGALEKALLQAVLTNRIDIADFLCNLNRASSPRHHVIDQAILMAARLGDLTLVVFFSRLVGKKIIEQVIQLAAGKGHLKMVQHCCELHSPNRQAIYGASKKALSNGHKVVVEYFRDLMELMPLCSTPMLSQQAESTAALRVIPLQHRLRAHSEPRFNRPSINRCHLESRPEMRRSASCQLLSQFGMFGSQSALGKGASLAELAKPFEL